MVVEIRAAWLNALLILIHGYYGAGLLLAAPGQAMASTTYRHAVVIIQPDGWGWALLASAALCIVGPLAGRWGSPTCRVLAAVPSAGLAVLVGVAAAEQLVRAGELQQGWGAAMTYALPVLGHAVLLAARLRAEHQLTRREQTCTT